MSNKSAVHIASVPEADTLLFLNFFRIDVCSSSASSLLHSTPQPSFLFAPIIVRTSFLSTLSRMPFGSNCCYISSSSSRASFRCLDSRYHVALISHPQRCTVPAQPAADHTHPVARAVDYTVLYTCDMVLQNPFTNHLVYIHR